jgi:hypothetical protein
VAGNNSAWGFAAAPDGDQVAFLQSAPSGTGTITHNVAGLTPGASYRISFSLAQRPGFGVNPVTVTAAGTNLGTFTPPSSAFSRFTTPPFQANGGTITVSFTGATRTEDSASGLDLVSVGPP